MKKHIANLREDIRRMLGDVPPAIAFMALSELQMVYAIAMAGNNAEKAQAILKNQALIACGAIEEAKK